LSSVQGFRIVKCLKCGLSYVNPRLDPKNLKELYSLAYFKSDNSITYGYDDYLSDRDAITRTFRRRWDVMRPFIPKAGTMLDIGCACGFLMTVAKENGWKTKGLDISEGMANYGRTHLNNNITIGKLPEAYFMENSFDLITIWDTIEHSTDPSEDIKIISRLLKPGGILSVITPDSESLHAKLFGEKWVEYLRPREHIYFLSNRTLKTMLDRAGLNIKKRTTVGKFVTWRFALDRLSCYWPKTISVIAVLMRALGLYYKTCYIDPRDKMFVIARKENA
jgi:2-polyprenyl-3-methyl-5-hydroxy-6-metoxy-1,4-benzoquinol methylase